MSRSRVLLEQFVAFSFFSRQQNIRRRWKLKVRAVVAVHSKGGTIWEKLPKLTTSLLASVLATCTGRLGTTS